MRFNATLDTVHCEDVNFVVRLLIEESETPIFGAEPAFVEIVMTVFVPAPVPDGFKSSGAAGSATIDGGHVDF